jgi:hypothetical protein
MVVHTCSHSAQETQENPHGEASLGYIARPCLQKKKKKQNAYCPKIVSDYKVDIC